MPQRYVDAQYLRLLHQETVRRADSAAELDAYCQRAPDRRTNAIPINTGLHHSVRLTGGGMRRRSRWKLLQRRSRV